MTYNSRQTTQEQQSPTSASAAPRFPRTLRPIPSPRQRNNRNLPPYSYRSAINGSARVARLAGITQAATVTAPNNNAIAKNVTGSNELTPNNRPLMNRVRISAPTPPATTPA